VEAIGGVGQGYFLTLGIAYLLLVLAAVVLTLGGVLLLLRKAAGKFVTIGGAAAMAFVTLAGTGAGLIISRFGFFGGIFAGLPVVFFFTLCAGGFLIFALMDKDVNRALR
jgi:hypothetical protein